jgi:hypothetical protein
MRGKNKERKKPIRTFNANHIKKGVCMSVNDLHQAFGIDQSCVHRWQREEGLIPIDGKQPALFYCETVKQFLEYKNNSKKYPKGKEGDIACMKCRLKRRLKRRPFKDEVIIAKKTKVLINLQALCECCGTQMNTTKNSATELEIHLTWNYKVVEILPKFIKSNKQFIQKKDIPKETFQLQNQVLLTQNRKTLILSINAV